MSSAGVMHVELRPGAYADSVTLLQVGRTVQQIAGVTAAQVAMATTLNLEVLAQMGFEVPPAASPNEMVVAVLVEGPDVLDRVLAGVDSALQAVNTLQSDPGTLLDRGRPGPPCAESRGEPCWCRCPGRTPWWRRWMPSTPGVT